VPDLSVVIPMHDEEENVLPVIRELGDVLRRLDRPYEIIAIDDGSRDATFERLVAAQSGEPGLRAIRFTRNFGQTAAFAAGFAHSAGRFIVTLDGDGQNDPADIPALLALADRHDVVCGWRRERKDDFLTKHVPSMAANRLIGIVTGVRLHDYGCSMKVFRADVVKPLKLRPGMHRYFPALASQLGGRVVEAVVNHRPRRFGRSKYGLSRTLTVVQDLLHLRRLMREAVTPTQPYAAIYEIAEVRDGEPGPKGPGLRSL
jgi:glycosyltransferase involved in cell wall biosynthesis